MQEYISNKIKTSLMSWLRHWAKSPQVGASSCALNTMTLGQSLSISPRKEAMTNNYENLTQKNEDSPFSHYESTMSQGTLTEKKVKTANQDKKSLHTFGKKV